MDPGLAKIKTVNLHPPFLHQLHLLKKNHLSVYSLTTAVDTC